MRLSPRLDNFYEEIGVKTLDLLYPNCLPIASSEMDFIERPAAEQKFAKYRTLPSCMKREELFHNYYDTIEELQRDVDEYVEFFNNIQPHQRLGMQTPSEAERNFANKK